MRPIPRGLWALLAATALSTCAAQPALAQNAQVSGLPARGTPAASDQVPVLPVGATHLQATTVGAIAALGGGGALVSLNSFAGVDPTGSTNPMVAAASTTAIQAAIATGQSLSCNGVYAVTANIPLTALANNGQHLIGVGPSGVGNADVTANRCTFLPVAGPSGPFSGFVFTIDGSGNAGSYEVSWGFENISIDLSNVSDVGINGGFDQIAAFDGVYDHVRVLGDAPTARATTGASGNGTTATITFGNPVAYTVGQLIIVSGVTPSAYNGTYAVTAASSGSVSYASAATGSQTVAGTVSGFKEDWRFNGGSFTTQVENSQGSYIHLQGANSGYQVTTLNFQNFDGFQVFARYANGLHFVGGAYQGAGDHFNFGFVQDVDIQTDAEGSGTYLLLFGGNDSFIRSHSALAGLTELGGPVGCGYDCWIWDDFGSPFTYVKNFNNGELQLNAYGVAGQYSSFLSGSNSVNYYITLGRAGGESQWGIAAAANDLALGTVAGDTVFQSATAGGDLWLTSYFNSNGNSIEITPTGGYIRGFTQIYTQSANLGTAGFTSALGKPATDGQMFTLENAAGSAYMLCTSSATIGNSYCSVGAGADWRGWSDAGFSVQTYDLNAANGAATFAGQETNQGLAVSTAPFSATQYLVISPTKPTYSSGFSTGTPTIAGGGTAAFTLTLGATPGTTGVLTMPTATTGWNCAAQDRTTAAATVRETGATTTSVTFALASTVASDVVQFECLGY
jgi:hypothetical protein